MNEKRTSGSPNVGLLLLIPAAAVALHMAKRHHRMMWDEVGGPGAATPSRRHGHHRFAEPDADPAARDAFRLPPRIEGMLDTWHARAHEATAPTADPAA